MKNGILDFVVILAGLTVGFWLARQAAGMLASSGVPIAAGNIQPQPLT